MNQQLIIIIGGLGLVMAILLGLIYRINNPSHKPHNTDELLEAQTETAVKTIFDDKFREELKNRGRLHFEKIIGENAMFLQQDLRLTTSQLNDYMKQEITRKLKEEFAKYEQSITDAKQIAVESITKTQAVVEEQRKLMVEQLTSQLNKEKEELIKRFELHMVEIVNHYILAAIGNQIDLTNQLDYILSDLESNKKAIVEDIRSGA
jgi:F0F1-type ATP synthase membrane subunit b/b'